MFIIGSAVPTYWQEFLTSPFSPYENYASAYTSPQVGAFYNLGVVAFLILFTDIYLRLLRPVRLRVSPATAAFIVSVAATYVLSALVWKFAGVPTARTSIIGSSIVLTLFTFSGRDIVAGARHRTGTHNGVPVPFIPIVFAVASMAIYLAEYVNSSSAVSHLLGDALFAPMFALCQTAESGTAKRSGA